ncbi:helicase-exonuclease AddAB subunit AddA [Butyribacter sp.]|uniref:helicase-exonuclease AddAB subunit AddA n=1 Tax=Butyribacter sp. TaxID=2822465 RepID=UPI002A9FC05B|nr:helicase-exonuclease AddAB subunit AddA [Butyribacter sp.]
MGNTRWTHDQQRVIDARNCNLLVSAAAGSGKTAVLVERIIKLIMDEKNNVDIDRLLVVTFTNAAAAEMKTRVGEAIENKLLEEPDNEHLQRQASLLHNAQITTMHSFCQYIIRNYFHVIDIDPAFKVANENDMKIAQREVLSELIEKRYEAESGNENSGFHLFSEMFAHGRDDSKIETIVLDLYGKAMSYPWPKEWLSSIVEIYKCDNAKELEKTKWIKELVSYVKELVNSYKLLAKKAILICDEADGPQKYRAAFEDDIRQFDNICAADSFEELLDAFKKVSRMDKGRITKKDNVDAEKKDMVSAFRDSYFSSQGGMIKLQEKFFNKPIEQQIAELNEMAPAVDELVNLTIDFIDAFAERKKEEGVIDFNDMEHFALQILTDKDENGEVIPSEVAEELREYYQEIMTDEYQDSNYVQELILTSISGEPVKAPYMFMVGDVKQSIYGFRLARPELFMEKYNSYSLDEGTKEHRIDLKQNFRSRECVLESSNAIFEKIMKPCLGGVEYDEAARLVPGRVYEETEKKTAKKTSILLIDKKADNDDGLMDKELEAAAIGNKILEMVQGENPLYVWGKDGYHRVTYSDIVILLRSVQGWTEPFLETLSDMGIPVSAGTKAGFYDSIEILTMTNLLRIIDNPRQDIPLVSVLRSVFAGLSDDELAAIAIMPRTLDFWDAMNLFVKTVRGVEGTEKYVTNIVLDDNDAEKLAEKLEKFMETLNVYRELAKEISVDRLIQTIYDETDFYDIMSAMPAGEKRAANLDILLEQARDYAANGHHGIFKFTHFVENIKKAALDIGEASVNNESMNAVRIMTMHKSKGLQFPVVFVSGLGKSVNLMEANDRVIINSDYGVGTDYVNLELMYTEKSIFNNFLRSRIKVNALAEEVRMLYVAMTRAEEKLFLTGVSAKILQGNMGARGEGKKKITTWKEKGQNLEFSGLLSLTKHIDMVMAAIADRPVFKECIEELEPEKIYGVNDELFDLEVVSVNNIVSVSKENRELAKQKEIELVNWDADKTYDEEMRDYISQNEGFSYKYKDELGIPVKASVSELKRLAMEKLDEFNAGDVENNPVMENEVLLLGDLDVERSFEEISDRKNGEKESKYSDIPRPDFMKKEEVKTGAARGTLYHLVMEHIPYERIDKDFDFAVFIKELVQDGYMTDEDASALDVKKFEWFAKSSLCGRMRAAAVSGELKREQPFMIGIPANEVYSEKSDSEELIMIQGIIDAFFYEGDDIVLVDYKTDFVMKGQEEKLAERYKTQLDYYARALESVTGKKVNEKLIYSFSLGKIIEVG